MNKKEFCYYISFFHDGSLNDLRHKDANIEFDLNSACLEAGENKYSIILDDVERVVGTLVVVGVNSILVNKKPFSEELGFYYDDGDILDFEVRGYKVELGIRWVDYPPKPDPCEYSMIEIEADHILWKDALNDVTLDLTGLWTGNPPK